MKKINLIFWIAILFICNYSNAQESKNDLIKSIISNNETVLRNFKMQGIEETSMIYKSDLNSINYIKANLSNLQISDLKFFKKIDYKFQRLRVKQILQYIISNPTYYKDFSKNRTEGTEYYFIGKMQKEISNLTQKDIAFIYKCYFN